MTSNHGGGDKILGRRKQNGRTEGHGGFDENENNIIGHVRPDRDQPDDDEDGRVRKRPHIAAHEDDQKSSSSDATAFATPARLLRSSSSVKSTVSDGTPSFSGTVKEVTRALNFDSDAEGRACTMKMKPELKYVIEHLELNSRYNKELRVGFKMFMSAFKFMETVAFLAKELTFEDNPSPNH